MKFKTNHKILSLIVAGTLLTASVPALALTGDTEQPIHID
ncbi:MAG: lipopolysaccharide ABC transporter substrate-binding protein LptA, partial [Hafnia alvei]